MRHPFVNDLRALYSRTGMTSPEKALLRPALVLTEKVVRTEAARGNMEVLVVLCFAVNPSRFASHVEVLQLSDRPAVFRYRVKSTGNTYDMTATDVFEIAVNLLLRMCRKSEVLA